MRYIDQDTLDQCREALRQGGKLDDVAARLHVDPEELARLSDGGQRHRTPLDKALVDRPHTERPFDLM